MKQISALALAKVIVRYQASKTIEECPTMNWRNYLDAMQIDLTPSYSLSSSKMSLE